MPNGRARPPPPPLTLAQQPAATLAPRCAQRSAGSGGPLRHGRLCRRPGRPVPAESPSRALRAASWKGGIQGVGKGVRPKASQSAKDFLLELPERDTRWIYSPGRGPFHHCVGARLIRVMRANLRARKPFTRRSCPRARHGGGTSDWWSAGGFRWREESRFRGAASSGVPPCCGGLRREQNPRLDHDPATRRLPAPEGSGSRRMAELETANRFPAP